MVGVADKSGPGPGRRHGVNRLMRHQRTGGNAPLPVPDSHHRPPLARPPAPTCTPMSPLSDKAKGKQRAHEPAEGDAAAAAASSSARRTKPLVIRFTEGLEDLHLPVAQDDAVRDVKRKVRGARALCVCAGAAC